MGLVQSQHGNTIYLNLSFGKFRRKCDANTEGAIERETQSGEKTYAIEYDKLFGVLENIAFKTSQYGNQWEVYINDAGEKYCVQMKEGSRLCDIFLQLLPNIRRGGFYTLSPWDYEDKRGKRKVGFKIEDEAGNAVDNYYLRFDKQPDDSWKVTTLHDYPAFVRDPKESDEKMKKRFKRFAEDATEFLSEKAREIVAGWNGNNHEQEEAPPEYTNVAGVPPVQDDLPF